MTAREPAAEAEFFRDVLDAIGVDEPPALELAERVADARDVSVGDAQERVYAALDDGVLTEHGEGFGGIRLAAEYRDESTSDEGGSTDENPTPEASGTEGSEPESTESTISEGAGWSDADFTESQPGVWADEQVERDQWMAHTPDEKQPFAPWGDSDAPVTCNHHSEELTCAECGHDARYKWGYEGNYADHNTAREWRDMDPRLAGLAYIQRESDPLAFVDGDDVRDPETGEVHPVFRAFLEHLGLTYADVSVSGAGVHAVYLGDLPEGVKEATFEIDTEPWGSNEDVPAVEIYNGKHVCIATGDHVPGTPTESAEWDADALEAILRANGELTDREASSTAFEEFEADDYEPTATGSEETTDDIRDVFAALDRLNAQRVAERTIVREWLEPAHREYRAFAPTWASSDYDGTAVFATSDLFKDTGKRGGKGGPAAMAAIDAGLVTDRDTPERVEGDTWMKAVDHLRELGFSIPELERGGNGGDYGTDPRKVSATVDPRRAWEAARRVTPHDLAGDRLDDDTLDAAEGNTSKFACPACGAGVDVVRAVAVETGLADCCDSPLTDEYPTVYNRAREQYGAPLPRYYTTTDAVAEFSAVLDVIGEVDFWHLEVDALRTDVTAEGDDVSGEAVRALDPAWRESESGESVLVFDSGTVWDADTERSLDALEFVALDSGLIDHPDDELAGGKFTTAYRRAREQYGAPLPRWEPALDGSRDITPMLPPKAELLDNANPSGVDTDGLDNAREEVEQLIGRAVDDDGEPTVVTALPATGKTTGTVKTARERPLSYLAPRKELQAQALEKAERWGVSARVLPVFSESRVLDDVLSGALSHVREVGKDRLRDRWSILSAAVDGADDITDPAEIFIEEDDEEVELERPTCNTAEGEHGVAWALAVHVARRLGYTPREIHTQAQGLFGAELPCSGDHDEEEQCDYSAGWERVRDADEPAGLLVGSYVHAHVESARTHYSRSASGEIERGPRALVLDEYPGEAYVREFDEKALDFATWLASALRGDVADRRDMLQGDLWSDEFVRAWLEGDADEHGAVSDATTALSRKVELLDAREAASEILREVEDELLEALGLAKSLEAVAGDGEGIDAFAALSAAVDDVDAEHPASGVASWVSDAVLEPLDTATMGGTVEPSADIDTDALPVAGDLRELVEEATEAAATNAESAHGRLRAAVTALTGGREGCRRLAAWATDGYAHPNAHHLLRAVITPTEGDDAEGERIFTSSWAFDPDATDGTVLDVVDTGGRARTVLDRNDHGALLQTPPSRTAGDGSEVPVVGLDATGRAELWANALREEVTTEDIHDNAGERAAFLENQLDLRVLQAADRPRPYEGDPGSKDTDGDVALLQAIADEYAGVEAPRQRGGEATAVGKPAAITTKGVREVLENDSRLDDVVSAWENFGNVTGANDLGGHQLAAILGSQHYGDDQVERFAALAGEEVDTSRSAGRGGELDYGNPLANAYLAHMRDDQVMQATLRFARGDSGATVVARTSALRDDLPVVGEAQVVETWNDTATAIAREYRRLGSEFTVADVRDVVDVTKRQVRRVLAELVDAGYLERLSSGDGVATVYGRGVDPGAGEVSLPDRESAVAPSKGGRTASNQYYTWNVRVGERSTGEAGGDTSTPRRASGAPPAPTPADGGEPPT